MVGESNANPLTSSSEWKFIGMILINQALDVQKFTQSCALAQHSLFIF